MNRYFKKIQEFLKSRSNRKKANDVKSSFLDRYIWSISVALIVVFLI